MHWILSSMVVFLLLTRAVGAFMPGPRILEMRGVTHAGRHTVVAGETVAPGKTLMTSPDGKLHLRYNDGANVVLERNTQYRTIEQSQSSETVWGELIAGGLLVRLPSRVGPESARDARRFALRVRNVVLGARNAEFRVEAPPAGLPQPVTVHVFAGDAEVAMNQGQLAAGKGTRLGPGQSVRLEPGIRSIPSPQSFDPEQRPSEVGQ